MEIAIVLVLALLVAGAIYFKKANDKAESKQEEVIVDKKVTPPTKEAVTISVLKSPPAVAQKLPTKNKLLAMTKKDLIDLGNDLGVTDLKTTLKKEELVNELRTKFAAVKKAAK